MGRTAQLISVNTLIAAHILLHARTCICPTTRVARTPAISVWILSWYFMTFSSNRCTA
jgi:NaMN:DMB phosphoribosyltransferase